MDTQARQRAAGLKGYGIPIVAMASATILSVLVQPFLAGHSANALFYLLATLASAWFGGYGPGLAACLIGLLLAPYLFQPRFNPLHIDLVRAALVLAASAFISYVGQLQRSKNEELTRLNLELESARLQLEERVQVRTQELQVANEELQKLNDTLNEFAYSASHDLQQPLRTMTTYGQLLQRKFKGNLDGEAELYLSGIVAGGFQMNALLSDLLTYCRSINLRPPEAESIESHAVLLDVLANLRPQLDEIGAVVSIGVLPTTRMHRFHLLELFQNLISNAIKYHGPDPLIVDISFEEKSSSISVRDNGIGISPDDSTRIFGLFKRLHSADCYAGTGVGLAICKAVVERYGCRIWVEQNPDKGSTFRFTIPLDLHP